MDIEKGGNRSPLKMKQNKKKRETERKWMTLNKKEGKNAQTKKWKMGENNSEKVHISSHTNKRQKKKSI